MVRAGKHGEREQLALENNLAIIGWEEVPDLSQVKASEELQILLNTIYPQDKSNTLTNYKGQIWSFIDRIKEGDLVALPLKGRPNIAVGRVNGPYTYRRDLGFNALHVRPVHWMKEIPRTSFDPALLFSFGAFMTVCQIRRNNAEEIVKHLLEGKNPPIIKKNDEDTEIEGNLDLETISNDQIRNYMVHKFKGHGLPRLVAEILKAQGYHVTVSPPGADGGADIVAGMGPLGFDSPRIVVQVKSGEGPIDSKAVNELQGVIKNFQADHGLFISWGGFKKSIGPKEQGKLFFEIRFWDGDDLIQKIQENYEAFPKEIQAELPLKRIWTLVPEEGEE